MSKGKVFLIGAGPGDPALLTVRGREVLSRADAVVYDALLSPRLLEWARPGATRHFVGKRGRTRSPEQGQINDLLLRLALRGRTVARLKGGDPCLFGRGGEEAAFLSEHSIPYEIIPGVTSASALICTGIPLTDRRLGSMVTLVTGHEKPGRAREAVEWSRISRKSTLVIYMGLGQLSTITDRLLHLNWGARTPAAAVRWASTSQQTVVEGTLGNLAERVHRAKLDSPVLVVIGRVAGLRQRLKGIDAKPLFGRHIVITRAADQAPEFAWLLEQAGAEVISFPTIQIRAPRSWQALDEAIRRVEQFDWVLFTSVNGVSGFFDRLRVLGRDVRDLKGARLGAIGPKTCARLEALGLRVDAFPSEYRAEALARTLGRVRGLQILLARAQEARDVLPKTLTAQGATVTVAPVYQTVKALRAAANVKARLLNGEIDAVTFTSSSTVDGFMRHFSPRQRRALFETCRAAVIGPITAATLRGYGVRPAIRASSYTIEALARAIVKHFTK